MKLSAKILSVLLCLSMLVGVCTFFVSAAPATLNGSVKTDSAPITINGTNTGATLTQYLLQQGLNAGTVRGALVGEELVFS